MTDALIDLLSDVSHRFQQCLRDEAQAAEIDLTPFEAKALVTIARLPGSTQQAIAARMGCDKAQLARAVKILEARALIARKASADDWRAWDIVLTPGGEAIFADLKRRRAAIAQDCLAQVSQEERENLHVVLTKMAEGLALRDGR